MTTMSEAQATRGASRSTSNSPAQPPSQAGPLGTQRRLQALMARSWSPEAISRATCVDEHDIIQALSGRDVTPELAVAVAAAYEQLWDQQPPRATPEDRQTADAAAEHARQRGWAPPMAWDDDQLDRPDGQPAPGWKPSRTDRHRAADLVEDAEWVRQHGGYRLATAAAVAARLGVSTDRLEHAYVRARRHAARDAQPQAEAI